MNVQPNETLDPIAVLVEEHDRILEALDAAEARLLEEGRGQGFDAGFWKDLGEFLYEFADRRHHDKEEDLLFPALLEAGLPHPGGPVDCMLSEHETGRSCVRRIRSGAEEGDAGGVHAAIREFMPLPRQHILKENQVLFRMAEQLLAPPARDSLAEASMAFTRRHDAERPLQADLEILARLRDRAP